MLTRIGAPRPATDADVVDLLLDCHHRIRSFTELAVRLATAERPPEADVADAAERVRRYFVEALPLHVADEEESLLPRLAGRDRAVDTALVAMHREHREHEDALARVIGSCVSLADRPGRHAELADALGEAARDLQAQFERHLASEERIVFPALRRLASDEERRRFAEELRARRAPGRPAQSSR